MKNFFLHFLGKSPHPTHSGSTLLPPNLGTALLNELLRHTEKPLTKEALGTLEEIVTAHLAQLESQLEAAAQPMDKYELISNALYGLEKNLRQQLDN